MPSEFGPLPRRAVMKWAVGLTAFATIILAERFLARQFDDDMLAIVVLAAIGVFCMGVFRPLLPDSAKDARRP